MTALPVDAATSAGAGRRGLLRLTLALPSGNADVALAPGATLGDALDDVVAARAEAGPAGFVDRRSRLTTLDGQVLDPQRPVRDLPLHDGEVVVVLPAGLHEPDGPAAVEATGSRRDGAAAHVLVALAGLAVLGGLGLASLGPESVRLAAGAAGLLLAPTTLLTGDDARGLTARLLAPAVAAVAVAVALDVDAPRQRPLAMTAAAVAAAAVSALLRLERRRGDASMLVWLVTSAGLAAAAGLTLLTDLPLTSSAALLAAASLPLVRLLPPSVIRVPDEELLEIDHVSVTAWSAHGPGPDEPGDTPDRAPSPPPRDTGDAVAPDTVTTRIRRGRTLLDSAVIALVLLELACVPAVLDAADGLLQTVAADVLAGCLAAGLPLCARAVRGLLARVALVLGGVGSGMSLLVALMATGTGARVAIAVAGALAGALVVPAALALGRGWRSVYWARTADILEGLAVGLVLPAGLLAAGAFEYVRQLVS